MGAVEIIISVSVISFFFRERIIGLQPNPNLEDQGLFFVWPLHFDQSAIVRPSQGPKFPTGTALGVIDTH